MVTPSPAALFSRVTASLVGGYVFVWGFTALCTTVGVAMGMPYVDGLTLAYLLAFLVFLAVFCWAFAARRLAWLWSVLVGGGAAMTALAWLLSRSLA